MAQDWNSPPFETAQYPPQPAAIPPVQATSPYAMRPLSTGEILDSTFTLYRSRFWLFAGLAALGGGWSALVQGLQLLVHHQVLAHYGAYAARIEQQSSSLFTTVLMLPVVAVVYAASVFALSEVYLGRYVSAGIALKATRGKWYRYVGISLWQLWSAIWLPVLLIVPAFILILAVGGLGMKAVGGLLIFVAVFGGGVYGFIAYIRNSLAVPAAVAEGIAIRPSMRRSKNLAAGTKGRIFVVLLVAFAMYMVAVTVESPLLFLIGRHPTEEHVIAQAVLLLVNFVAHTLVSPVATIGLTLVYFDQRVRKEAFDLVMLMGTSDPVPGLAEPFVGQAEPFIAPAEPFAAPAEPIIPPAGDDGLV
jgi:hypothetical protein